MKRAKIVGIIVGIVLFVAAIGGLTYALVNWTSENINKQVSSECFDVLYDEGADLSGAIVPSYDYTGGLYATVKLNISTKCNVNAKGILYLDTSEDTSSNLFREGLLNYQVLRNGVTPVASGNITGSGETKIDLGVLTKSQNAFTRYDIYVWLDYNYIENSDINSVYYGSIRTEAIQFDKNGPVNNNSGNNNGNNNNNNDSKKLTDYITNLYLNNKNKVVTNNNIGYKYAESVNLMNDRLGGTSSGFDDGNIRYYGATPNNYIDIGDRTSDNKVILYRIIGLFKDVRLADGTKKDLIKVIRDESIGNYSWDNKSEGIGSSVDDLGSNDWTDSRLMMMLNPGYDKYSTTNPFKDASGDIIYGYEGSLWWNSKSGTCYSGSRNATQTCNFTSTGLSSNVHNKIETVVWNLGGKSDHDIHSDEYYILERGTTVYTGRPTEWEGKVALMYPSDYGYATDFNSCSQTLNDYDSSDNSYACGKNDWLFISGYFQWQLTPLSSYSNYVSNVSMNVYVSGSTVYSAFDVLPVFYLNSELVINSGSGKSNDPYVVG